MGEQKYYYLLGSCIFRHWKRGDLEIHKAYVWYCVRKKMLTCLLYANSRLKKNCVRPRDKKLFHLFCDNFTLFVLYQCLFVPTFHTMLLSHHFQCIVS